MAQEIVLKPFMLPDGRHFEPGQPAAIGNWRWANILREGGYIGQPPANKPAKAKGKK